ncbi:kinesin-like protein KIF14 [Lucilia cuprina]|uniref:kinesin-like protein KIF14 n=1 Tax=Lucilia cuprina TaxID=7375 RepID=UPI001F06F823|nr:kinesin-like protein KIF14 [Lucilia cuprina]
MNNSRYYMSPNRILKNNAKAVFSDGKTTLRDGVLISCAQKRLNQNINSVKNDLNESELLKDSPILSSPSTSRCKSKNSVINACYTPSSLFRSANACSTPISGRSTKKSKQCFMNSSRKNNDVEDRLKVAVRVRPLNAKECLLASVSNIIKVNNNEVTVMVGSSADASSGVSHSFAYDHVFSSCNPDSPDYAHQKDVFLKTAQPLIVRSFEGYNTCLFAYGQTGSGKSYSMMGIDTLESLDRQEKHIPKVEMNADAGIIPRFCHELFQYIENEKEKFHAEVEVSYFEIYNEKIHDLLCVSQDMENSTNGRLLGGTPIKMNRKALKVREHPIWGPYVVDLSVHPVDSFEALRNWLIVGNSQRATAATGLNDKSSRSHSIFNIMLKINKSDSIECKDSTTIEQSRRSKISLVDLAGSERISGSSSERIREGVHINKSLLTLGKVISALSDDRNSSVFVPYRESVLTWLLRENLGGNSKTVMLATISPASIHVDETLATLRYACQARRIVNRVKVNESEHDKVIRELKSEVERLKSLHYEYERQKRLSISTNATPRTIIIETSNINETEIENLREQLSEREKELQLAQKSWMERLKEADDLRKSGLHLLKRKGLAIELDKEQKHACLINLTEDPMLTETLFYIIPNGCVKIGRTRSTLSGTKPDIILDGPLVAHNHCIIENINGELYVTPENKDFETYLNGELVKSKKQIFHGDRLVIGGSHFFRVSNPFCSQKEKKKKMADFYQAYQEVLETQEEKLRLELEEEKRIALSDIETNRIEHERDVKERMDKIELEQLMLKCNKEILESEKKIIDEKKNNIKTMESDILLINPAKMNESKLFDEINNIMQQPSQGSLHKVQLMVKEATQHCRNHGLLYEFKQSKVIDEFGIYQTKILIIDKGNELKAEWPIARLEVWLESIREQENWNSKNIFNCFDIEWEKMDISLNDSVHDSLNASRINLNISAYKETILKSEISKPQQINNLANCRSIKEMDFENLVKAHIQKIQCSTIKLKDICKIHENDNNFVYSKASRVLSESIERLEYTLNIMQTCFDEAHFDNTKSVRFLMD